MRAHPTRDLEQALPRVFVSRDEGDEARERLEGPRVVAEPLVAQLGDPAQELATISRFRHRLQADLEHAHEIAHVIPREVHALEHHGRTRPQRRHVEALLDDVARLAPGRVRPQNVFELV